MTSVAVKILRKARRASECVRNRLRPSALVLMYHRVAQTPSDPWDIAVRPEHFDEHMQVLAERCRVLSIGDLGQDLAAGRLRRSVVVTFDDGYLDNLEVAQPILARRGVPATVYVSTMGMAKSGAQMWWDRLAAALLHDSLLPARLELADGASQDGAWDVPPPDGAGMGAWRAEPSKWRDRNRPVPPRGALYLSVYRYLAALPFDDREQRVRELGEWSGKPLDEGARTMTAAEVHRLSQRDGITIGAHTVTHPFLSRLSDAQRRREIVDSKRELEEAAERPVVDFAFPNGDRFDGDGEALVAAGYTTAGTSRSDVVTKRDLPMAIPRVVVRDWDGEQFRRWLWRWGHA